VTLGRGAVDEFYPCIKSFAWTMVSLDAMET
jgi:hypothetical protein